jgi:hypothetical protein
MVSSSKVKLIIGAGQSTTIPLGETERKWLTKHYPDFVAHKKSRGTKREENAQFWVTNTIVPQFIAEFYEHWDQDRVEEEHLVIKADYVSTCASPSDGQKLKRIVTTDNILILLEYLEARPREA